MLGRALSSNSPYWTDLFDYCEHLVPTNWLGFEILHDIVLASAINAQKETDHEQVFGAFGLRTAR